MRKTYKYRLYTSKRDKHLISRIEASASIYNHCIALHKRYYRLFGKHLNKQANQNLVRKTKGSNNWHKAKKQLTKVHRGIASKRNDFQWKLANELVRDYDNLFFETLSFKGMQKLWGRKIGDLGIYGFLQKVEFVCSQHSNKFFGKIDKWFPSTKLCFDCGYKNNNLTLKRIDVGLAPTVTISTTEIPMPLKIQKKKERGHSHLTQLS